MNFTFTWIMDKLGYMPKIDMEIGKPILETEWPFPVPAKKKPAAKKTVVKKATKVAKKAK